MIKKAEVPSEVSYNPINESSTLITIKSLPPNHLQIPHLQKP